jgi:hypothetical protein
MGSYPMHVHQCPSVWPFVSSDDDYELSSSVPLMPLEKKPSLPPASHFSTVNTTLTTPCKDELGASKPDSLLQEGRAESPGTLTRSSSALSRTSKVEEILSSPGPAIRSHVSLESLTLVKPLRTLHRMPGSPNLAMTPPMAGSSSCTMAEARELFEQYGIDRPAG